MTFASALSATSNNTTFTVAALTPNMVYTIVVHFRAKDEPGAIEKLTKKLQEASQVYSQDKETISW